MPGSTVLSASQLKLLLLWFSSLIFIRTIFWRAAAILHFLIPCIFILRRQLVDEPTPSLTVPGGSQETAAVPEWYSKRVVWQACNSTLEDQCVMAALSSMKKKNCRMNDYFNAGKHFETQQIIFCLRTQCICSAIRAWYTWNKYSTTTLMLWDVWFLWANRKLRLSSLERGAP